MLNHRWISRAFGILALAGLLVWVAPVKDAKAEAAEAATEAATATAVGACPGLSPCPPWGAFLALQTTNKEMIKPTLGTVLWGMLYNAITFVGNRLAYDTAAFLATGDKGQMPLFYPKEGENAWLSFGLETVGSAVDTINSVYQGNTFSTVTHKSGTVGGEDEIVDVKEEKSRGLKFLSKFDLCAPPSPLVAMSISLGIQGAYSRPKPKCDLTGLPKKWDSFTESVAKTYHDFQGDPRGVITKEVTTAFAGMLQPGVNELTVAVQLNVQIDEEVSRKRTLGTKDAEKNSGFKSVTDLVTGNVKTPGAFTLDIAKKTIVDKDGKQQEVAVGTLSNPSLADFGAQFALQVGSTFVNTLLSKGILTRVFNGIFSSPPPQDPFGDSSSAPAITSISSQIANVTSVSPISITNYDAISNFVVCPSGTINRNIDNCVMDSTLATAVSRGASGQPLTVREAMDPSVNMLKGDWILVSPNDPAKNQDPLCYTYAYCYGNLVKMRKARIISVGWEMAAAQSRPDKPYTLKQVVDAFDDCKNNPTICHLIDPNWVIKYPTTQCRAQGNGEILATSSGAGRNTYCADVQNCVSERPDGTCASYGYCTREKNTWKFQGDSCPTPFASCLTFTDKTTSKPSSFLLNTVDYGACSKDNAGCLWYSAAQFLNGKNTTTTADDTWDWQNTDASRAYFNGNVSSCSASDDGCASLIPASGVALNMVQNPGFEKGTEGSNVPDAWVWSSSPTAGKYDHDAQSPSGVGGSAASVLTDKDGIEQSNILLSPNTVYTFSAYAKGTSTNFGASVVLTKMDKITSPNMTGIVTTCSQYGAQFKLGMVGMNDTEYTRYSCTFTTLNDLLYAKIALFGANVRYDDIQLETGTQSTPFVTGYNPASAQPAYLKVPPAYLNCVGGANDPTACDQYAHVCSAPDVGCALYTPDAGGLGIPATITGQATDQTTGRPTGDYCPNECVGYAAFKQVGAPYEPAPAAFVNFIPTKAKTCPAQAAGCDSFTKLADTATGGETVEYYTNLRACSVPADASADNSNKTYFTWEGSDASGYQLKTWQLYKSDRGEAPCTKWNITDIDPTESVHPVIRCIDTVTDANPAPNCTSHDDIRVTNPDCREFYDEAGAVHYRNFSQTVTVSDQCASYRKTSSDEDNCKKTGGLWMGSGECRYLGLSKESLACPAAASGCRLFTASSGNNLRTVLTETFEDPNFQTPKPVGAAVVSPSPEAVATGGHSMKVETQGADQGFDSIDPAGTKPAFKGKITAGRTFMVSFWAKGSMGINVAFVEKNGTGTVRPLSSVQLDTSWRPYTFGPFDSSLYPNFDDTAVLRVTSAAAGTFFIDNFELKQSGDAIAVIKGSWSVPASCDTAPNGAASPQYYRGCEAYTDQKSVKGNFFQFSRLCSEKVVGCQAFYNTQNSKDTGGKTYNATCTLIAGGKCSNDASTSCDAAHPCAVGKGTCGASQGTACTFGTTTYCTIAEGRSSCAFNLDGAALPNPSTSTAFKLELGKDARVVTNDTSAYYVDNGSNSCAAEAVGCRGFGKPVFTQDRSSVASFQSVYLLDQPDQYDKLLCTDPALFCKVWSTAKNGDYFFKDPGDKQCEYKTNVKIDSGDTYDGWFKKGTNKSCYDDNKSGRVFGIWRNGDRGYADWVGSCSAQYDRCTEFVDPSDKNEEARGAAYTLIDNDALGRNTTQGAAECKGQTSRKQGCALFNDTNVPDVTFASGPSYVLSTHADVLAEAQQSSSGQADALVDPVDCRTLKTWKYNKTDGTKADVDLCALRCQYLIPKPEELRANGIERKTGDTDHAYGTSCLVDTDCPELSGTDGQKHVGTCVASVSVTGSATDRQNDSLRTANDVNRIINVQRDRVCGQWLACTSSMASWNSTTNAYDQICGKVQLCTKAGNGGTNSQCDQVSDSAPVVLSSSYYQRRDTSWSGQEFSGYSIPNQLPVDLYRDVKIGSSGAEEPTLAYVAGSCRNLKVCSGTTTACTKDTDCAGSTCVEQSGVACHIGTCGDTGTSCSSNADCHTGVSCIIGFCQKQARPHGTCSLPARKDCTANTDCDPGGVCTPKAFCFDDTDCATATATPVCDKNIHMCVDHVTGGAACASDDDAACTGGAVCRYAENTKVGGCYTGQCVTSIRDTHGTGLPDSLQRVCSNNIKKSCRVNSECENNGVCGVFGTTESSCRTYPETDSPFPASIVKLWKKPGDVNSQPTEGLSTDASDIPYQFVRGYDSAKTYSPVKRSDGSVTVYKGPACEYDKTIYGQGVTTRYYPKGTGGAPTSVCVGGMNPGKECTSSTECGNGTLSGTCEAKSSTSTQIGWSGYCLEKDSSIQLFGSQSDKDRPCLTWLPVDQTYSATDIYAQFVNAGGTPTDKYYCVDSSVYYDISTTDIMCAEQIHNIDTDPAKFWNEDKNDCWKSIACPPNYFAITTVTEGDDDSCREGDNDCAYFCVPDLAYKEDGKTMCLPPDKDIQSNGNALAQETLNLLYSGTSKKTIDGTDQNFAQGRAWIDSLFAFSPGDPRHSSGSSVGGYLTDIYLAANWDNFKSLKSYYQSCVTRGVPTPMYTGDYAPGLFPSSNFVSQGTFTGDSGYYTQGDKNPVNENFYLGCSQLIQTSSSTLSTGTDPFTGFQSYNNAWSERTWTQKKGGTNTDRYSIVTPPGVNKKDFANFSTNVVQDRIFAESPDVVAFGKDNGYPEHTVMCGVMDGNGNPTGEQVNPTKTDDCPVGKTKVKGGVAYQFYANKITCQKNDSYGAVVQEPTCLLREVLVATDPPNKLEMNQGTTFDCDYLTPTDARVNLDLALRVFGGATSDGPGLRSSGEATGSGTKVKIKPSEGSSSYCSDIEVRLSGTAGDLQEIVNAFNCDAQHATAASFQATIVDPTGQRLKFTGPAPKELTCGESPVIKPMAASDGEVTDDAVRRLKQIYGSAMKKWTWKSWVFGFDLSTELRNSSSKIWKDYLTAVGTNVTQKGNYVGFDLQGAEPTADWNWTSIGDSGATSGTAVSPKPPIIRPVGDCKDGYCLEGDPTLTHITDASTYDNQFTVNGVITGPIKGGEGTKHVTASFYAFANENQMPLRRIVVDWGDSRTLAGALDAGGKNYMPNDQTTLSGSGATDNFYQNHRGRDENGPICGKQDNFGASSAACDSSYIAFSHDYICSNTILETLTDEKRTCHFINGKLMNSPCVAGSEGPAEAGGACVFAPRINVVDNWGWCAGTCPNKDASHPNSLASHPNGGCYGATEDFKGECNIKSCPNAAADVCSTQGNPWVNFGGYIIVSPKYISSTTVGG